MQQILIGKGIMISLFVMLSNVCLDEIEKSLFDKKQQTSNQRLARLWFWP